MHFSSKENKRRSIHNEYFTYENTKVKHPAIVQNKLYLSDKLQLCTNNHAVKLNGRVSWLTYT